MTTTAREPLLTTLEVAEWLNKNRSWLEDNRSEIPFIRVGRECRYDPKDVRAWIDKNPHWRPNSGRNGPPLPQVKEVPMTHRERTITILGGLLATAAFIIATYGVMALALFLARLTGKLP